MHHTISSIVQNVIQSKPTDPELLIDALQLPIKNRLDLYAIARLQSSIAEISPFSCSIINAKSGQCAENCTFCFSPLQYWGSPKPIAEAFHKNNL